ncbi:MAG: YbhN family protein [Bacteroidia bacterium]
MKKSLLNIGKFLLSLSLGLGILWYVYHSQSQSYQQQQCYLSQCEPAGIAAEACTCDEATLASFSLVDKLLADFGTVHLFWIFVSIGIYLLSNLSRAIRWRMMVEPLGTRMNLRNTFMAVMAGYLANTLLPRAGEVAQCGLLSRYEGVGVEKLFGTITVSRIIDVLSLGTVTGLMFLFEFDKVNAFFAGDGLGTNGGGGNAMYYLLALGVAGLAGLGVMFWQKEKLIQYGIFKKIFSIIEGFWEGIKAVGKVRSVGWFVFHSVLIWTCYFLMHYVAFFAFDPIADLPPEAGLTIFVFGSLGMVVPVPGGMGAYQWLVKIAFVTFYGIAAAEAFSAANILFWPIFITNITLGLASFLLLPVLNSKKIAD